MKHSISVLCLLLISHFVFGQSNARLQQIKPKWKLGDQKRVHSESFSKVFMKDSLLNASEAKADYSMVVIDTVKNYTLVFYNEPISLNIETNSSNPKVDSVINFITDIIKKIEKEIYGFKYELLIDKNTGQAFKVKNSGNFLKVIEKATSSMIDELGAKKGKSQAQIDSMKQRVVAYFKLSEPKILETAINQFNYIMQPYSFTYSNNSTISYKAMIQDVNALGAFGGVEMPAVLTVSSKQTGNSLTIKTDTDYDKEFLLKQIKKKYSNMAKLAASDIFCSEKVETVFSKTNNWIVSHKSNVVFIMKEVKVINETIVSFQ